MKIVVFPRGFIGFDAGQPEAYPRKADYVSLIKNLQNNWSTESTQSTAPFDPSVAQLWKEYVNGASYITSFDFRERILKAAFKAFGTTDFFAWCDLQTTNPFFSATHTKFMNDTFGFLETGKRSISVGSWRNIVAIGSPADNSKAVYRLDDFFRLSGPTECQRESNLVSIVQTWVSYENGYSDLLNTLAIFFGEI